VTNLIVAALAFLLLHLVVSGTRVRESAIEAVGRGAYLGLFSFASVCLLIWLAIAYGGVWTDPSVDKSYWHATPITGWIQLVMQLVALLFVVPGLTTRNPTSVGQEGALEGPEAVQGMLRITRHPFLWGVAIWAGGHIMVNGDLAGLILFGTMFGLVLFGTVSIDAKRERALGEKWKGFAAKTSNVPFAAIWAGRQTLNIAEIGWLRLVAAFVTWAVVLGAHPHIFGTVALPQG
jgi:uncharacterized membrane protein